MDSQNTDVRIVSGDELNFTREAERIQRLALARDSRIVTLGQIAFFSTTTGDAWMLDVEDGLAACLARNFMTQPIPIQETEPRMVIDWKADYEIEDEKFIVTQRTGLVEKFAGYPIEEILRTTQGLCSLVIPAQDGRDAALQRLKLGRNDRCPCGSGKKYKNCCLPKDEAIARQPQPSQARPHSADRTENRLPSSLERVELEDLGEVEPTESRSLDAGPTKVDWALLADEGEPQYQHPRLTDEENRIANAWWDQVKDPYLDNSDGGKVLELLHGFLDQHPRLFRYLSVEEELLLELKPMLREQGRSHDYLELLRRLRREQPDTYRECFGWFDHDLIADAIARGAHDEIPSYFSFFQEKGDEADQHVERVLNLLAWTGCESGLFQLAETTLDLDADAENLQWSVPARWLCLREALPLLHGGRSSPDDVRQMLSAQRKVLGLAPEILDEYDVAHRQLQSAAADAAEWKLPSLPGRNGLGYLEVMWNFTGWLVRHRRCLWVTAACMSRLVWEHWIWRSHRPRAKDPFQMNGESLTSYFRWKDDGDCWIGGVEPFAFIQAISWFGDYLLAVRTWTNANTRELHGVCAELHAMALTNHSPDNAALRLYPTFDALIAGLKLAPATDGPSPLDP